jgi:phosphoribosylaminoimidazolecarboxamide formyltransferase/IMP cyclohydrolase
MNKEIKSALISVYDKNGLDEIVKDLASKGVQLFSTGGTYSYIANLGLEVNKVEDLTGYPSILGGRVKTLHPKVFGGILAKRQKEHLDQLTEYDIPEIDLVIVDLYPFEETRKETDEETTLVEKIDIGGIALIRAAAKNYCDVLIISSKDQYADLSKIVKDGCITTNTVRKEYAKQAFFRSSTYDQAIHSWLAGNELMTLRYGENPHQEATYDGNLNDILTILSGKALSYNNLVDVDAAVDIMSEFKESRPTFAVIKHTNTCGLAQRDTVKEAWETALSCDPISAFGGILITNSKIDLQTAESIHKLFYEVLIAPDYDKDALELLCSKKKRVIIRLIDYPDTKHIRKSILNGELKQSKDRVRESAKDLKIATQKAPEMDEIDDMLFANIAVKHLKSNAIVLVKNKQLMGMGCGQTSRVDALKQAIIKARAFKLDLRGAVMGSDAFFPFPDCVEIANAAGIKAVIQPGGSIRDKDSVAYCDANDLSMVLTGNRHFKH